MPQTQFQPHHKVLIFSLFKRNILICSHVKFEPDEPHIFDQVAKVQISEFKVAITSLL